MACVDKVTVAVIVAFGGGVGETVATSSPPLPPSIKPKSAKVASPESDPFEDFLRRIKPPPLLSLAVYINHLLSLIERFIVKIHQRCKQGFHFFAPFRGQMFSTAGKKANLNIII